MLKGDQKIIKPEWYLEGLLNDGRSWLVPVKRDPFRIGRREECDLFIASRDVSRNHAEIFHKGKTIFIRDLKSTNGTFVNKTIIKTEVSLKDGDLLHFGDHKFRLCSKSTRKLEEQIGTSYRNNPASVQGFTDHFELSRREREILYLIFEGKSTKKIAEQLFISEGTAKNHINRIFKKTDTHSRIELMASYNNYQAVKRD